MEKNKLRFSWDLHWACNFRCPYCWWHGKWEEFAPRNRYPGTPALIKIWDGIYEKYGEAHIEIAGGEPTVYPDFGGLLAGLLKHHTVGMMTNLSGDIEQILVLPPELRARLKIGATFHPLFADLDAFIAKASRIRKLGMSIGILYLSYPPQIAKIPDLKKKFAENDLFFSVSTFWGTYEGREYPASYTPEELKIIDPALGERTGEKFQTEPLVTKGKLCHAGHTYAIIHPEGEVIRCGGGSWRGENIKLGNFFDGTFALWDEPRPCHSENCPCNEWAFLLEK